MPILKDPISCPTDPVLARFSSSPDCNSKCPALSLDLVEAVVHERLRSQSDKNWISIHPTNASFDYTEKEKTKKGTSAFHDRERRRRRENIENETRSLKSGAIKQSTRRRKIISEDKSVKRQQQESVPRHLDIFNQSISNLASKLDETKVRTKLPTILPHVDFDTLSRSFVTVTQVHMEPRHLKSTVVKAIDSCDRKQNDTLLHVPVDAFPKDHLLSIKTYKSPRKPREKLDDMMPGPSFIDGEGLSRAKRGWKGKQVNEYDFEKDRRVRIGALDYEAALAGSRATDNVYEGTTTTTTLPNIDSTSKSPARQTSVYTSNDPSIIPFGRLQREIEHVPRQQTPELPTILNTSLVTGDQRTDINTRGYFIGPGCRITLIHDHKNPKNNGISIKRPK